MFCRQNGTQKTDIVFYRRTAIFAWSTRRQDQREYLRWKGYYELLPSHCSHLDQLGCRKFSPKVLKKKKGNCLWHSVMKFVPSNKLAFCCSGPSKSRWLKSNTMWANDHPGQGTVLVVMVLGVFSRSSPFPYVHFVLINVFVHIYFYLHARIPFF